jgi:hypothetical protein
LHKRTSPKIFHRAKELRHTKRPKKKNSGHTCEIINWTESVSANTPALAGGARDTPLVTPSLTFVRRAGNWSLNWMEINTLKR